MCPSGVPGQQAHQQQRQEVQARCAALPDTFPQTKRYAAELTAGTGHDRFDFTLGLMIGDLAP